MKSYSLPSSKDAEIIETIASALKDTSALTRSAALKAMANTGFGPFAEGCLIRCMKDDDPHVRVDAAETAGKIRDERMAKPLIEALDDEEGDVVIYAIRSLGQILATGFRKNTEIKNRVVDRFIDILMQEDREYAPEDMDDELSFEPHWDVQLEAVRSLGLIGNKRAIDPLVDFLHDERAQDISEEVMLALNQIRDDAALDVLIKLLSDPKTLLRRRAAKVLGNLKNDENENVENALIKALRDEDPDVRISAALSLAKMKHTPALLSLLKDRDRTVRAQVVFILGGTNETGLMNHLLPLLKDPEGEVRREVAKVLGEKGERNAVPFLTGLLNDQEEMVQGEAAKALGQIRSENALDPLAKIAGDGERATHTRVSAINAIGAMGGRKSLRVLKDFMKDSKEEIVVSALLSLEKTGLPEGVSLIASILKSDISKEEHSESRQLMAARVLGNIHSRDSINALVDVLESDAPNLVREALISLGHMGKDEISPSLVRPFLFHENHGVRAAAVDTLGRIMDEGAITLLSQTLMKEDHSYIREKAVRVLGSFGNHHAGDILVESLKDEATEVRKAAVEGLGALKNSHALHPLYLSLYDVENFGNMRGEIVRSLKKMDEKKVIDHLLGIVKDDEQKAKHWIAMEAIGEIYLNYSEVFRLKAEGGEEV